MTRALRQVSKYEQLQELYQLLLLLLLQGSRLTFFTCSSLLKMLGAQTEHLGVHLKSTCNAIIHIITQFNCITDKCIGSK